MIQEKIKNVLTSFGYRCSNNKQLLFSKPIAFFSINALVGPDALKIFTVFRSAKNNELFTYNSKTLEFEDIEVDDYENISMHIANMEHAVLGSGGVIDTGLHDKPWNFLTLQEAAAML